MKLFPQSFYNDRYYFQNQQLLCSNVSCFPKYSVIIAYAVCLCRVLFFKYSVIYLFHWIFLKYHSFICLLTFFYFLFLFTYLMEYLHMFRAFICFIVCLNMAFNKPCSHRSVRRVLYVLTYQRTLRALVSMY